MPYIEVSEETLSKIKEQFNGGFSEVPIETFNDLIGKSLFIRTVTYHLVGKVEKIIGGMIELSTASWVADSGRFMNAIKDGELDEVEPLGQWFVSIGSIVDFGIWRHELPVDQK